MNTNIKKTAYNTLNKLLQEYENNPIDLLCNNDKDGEKRYIDYQVPCYARTLTDILSFYYTIGVKDFSKIKVLEIGSFLGIVSMALSRLGFKVTSIDIPEYMRNKNLIENYEKDNISHYSVNLRDYKLPFENQHFDLVIMCEVLEHLNFNPLPIFAEVNRVLKKDGLLYIATPNITSIGNRLKLLFGKSFYNPIRDYFAQLDKNDNMIVGLHWREYTINETKEILERLEFRIDRQYFFHTEHNRSSVWKLMMKRIICQMIPSFRDTQVTFARKKKEAATDFFFCEANR